MFLGKFHFARYQINERKFGTSFGKTGIDKIDIGIVGSRSFFPWPSTGRSFFKSPGHV